jgi:hypothetical protein
MPAYTLHATFTNAELGPQEMLEIGTIFEGRGYYLSYFVEPEDYERYLPIIQQMIDSFEIVESGNSNTDEDEDDEDDED